MVERSKFDLTGVELGGKLDLAGVKGTPAHPELDDPDVIREFLDRSEKAEEDDFARYDEYQAKIWGDIIGSGCFRQRASYPYYR